MGVLRGVVWENLRGVLWKYLRGVLWEYLRGVPWDYRRLFFDTKCFTSSLCEFLLSPCSAVRTNSSLFAYSPIGAAAAARVSTHGPSC